MTASLADTDEHRPRASYPTDLTDAEWHCIAPHLPGENLRGRPREHPVREILDAIFYVIRGGCAWRLLPHDFPPWGTVYYWFRRWRLDGLWQRILVAEPALRPQAAVSYHSGGCLVLFGAISLQDL